MSGVNDTPECELCRRSHRTSSACNGLEVQAARITELEAEVARLKDEQGRYDCTLTDGWVSIDMECDGGADVSCFKHFYEQRISCPSCTKGEAS
ncbi:hypothetical protein LCGC14_0587710 [marine sediment metagenome]|uniref:Uncharacterized protein n=1 Tax=marine sediment metagenome TaxID=412755 RepID=A0A0F9UMP6_9ZZZZ